MLLELTVLHLAVEEALLLTHGVEGTRAQPVIVRDYTVLRVSVKVGTGQRFIDFLRLTAQRLAAHRVEALAPPCAVALPGIIAKCAKFSNFNQPCE